MDKHYIPLEAAIKSTWMILEGMGYPRSENRSLERTVEAIFKSAPAADVVEAGEAEWRYQTMSVPGGKGQTYAKWSCSACKGKQKKRSRYCPDCGKRMKNGGYDNG